MIYVWFLNTGFLVSNIVSLAFSLAPSKDEFVR